MDGEVIEDYYTEVFKAFGPPRVDDVSKNVLLTDNARMHKRIREDLRGSPEEIMDWATESEEVSADTQQKLEVMAAQAPQHPTRADLLRALQEAGVKIYEIESLILNKYFLIDI